MSRLHKLREGTWVVHTHGEGWQAMELGVVRTLPNGSRGGSYHPIPQGLPGILLGPLVQTSSRRTKVGQLVRVLWMGRVFLCNEEDIERA